MNQVLFRILSQKFIPAVRSHVTVSQHIRSGAVLIHLLCPEERENFFSACFRTPPVDNTGTPHIIEHTVLCGSEKYPVKDPFMEMVRSSMATFINALTYGDRTLYPVGSLNKKDFLNLVSVYMDAVFNPLLKREFFNQEGHRLEFDQSSGKLTHNGVVYNEMKGEYTDPDSFMERETARELYPQGSCGKDSGGDPDSVAELTYQKLVEYYDNHYHPANCCLFVLSSIPFDEISEHLDGMLPDGDASRKPAAFTLQQRFSKPVSRKITCPGQNGGCTVLRAWMVDDAGDPVETLAFSLLEDVLLEDDSSPVRSALLHSGLGSDMSSCGYDFDPVQRNFIMGMKGVSPDKTDDLLQLLDNVLENLVQNGLDGDLVDNMLHRKELNLKYIGAGWPYAVMNAATAAWTHFEDINSALDLTAQIKRLRTRMDENPGLLEDMISRWLINNKHHVDLVFKPDENHLAEQEQREKTRLEEIAAGLSTQERNDIHQDSENLEKLMATPNTQEALSTLPKLLLSDVSRESPSVFHERAALDGGVILATDLHTSGVCYVDLGFDMSGLEPELLGYLPFYTGIVNRLGADELSHIEMASRELSCCGGINTSVSSVTSSVSTPQEHRLFLRFSSHCLQRDLEKMLDVIQTRFSKPRIENHNRIRSLVREIDEHNRSSIIPRGHAYASLAARAALSMGHRAADIFSGLPYIKLVSGMLDQSMDEIVDSLARISRYLNERAPRILAWTGPSQEREKLLGWFNGIKTIEKAKLPAPWTPEPDTHVSKGIRIDGGTSFAAAALPGLAIGHELTPAGIVMMRMLSEGYLWDEIRARMGAYGAGASLAGGAVSFYSYRDPSPAQSIQCFLSCISGGLTKLDLSSRAIEDSIIACVKGINPAVRPAMANGLALMRYLRGIDRQFVEKHRDSLLEVNGKSIGLFAKWLESRSVKPGLCVMAGREILDQLDLSVRTEI